MTLGDVNLEIYANETSRLPIIGRSGVGKSTQLYVMAALKWPSRGTVKWTFPDGRKFIWGAKGTGLSSIDTVRLRRTYFGFAFQNSTLSDQLLVEENLRYPLRIQNDLMRTSNAARPETGAATDRGGGNETVLETLRKVLLKEELEDISGILNRFPAQLSGGQRQRVALAQAMIHNPNVLFADEPAGNLDKASRLQVMRVLEDWLDQGKGKRMLVWVTHHPDDPEIMNCTRFLMVSHSNAGNRGATVRLLEQGGAQYDNEDME
ncbi:MAG: ATP-binding cassette domain-containing protein [bacterium]|nr:ATP-binding cassette domain-containing protein [bacterium]